MCAHKDTFFGVRHRIRFAPKIIRKRVCVLCLSVNVFVCVSAYGYIEYRFRLLKFDRFSLALSALNNTYCIAWARMYILMDEVPQYWHKMITGFVVYSKTNALNSVSLHERKTDAAKHTINQSQNLKPRAEHHKHTVILNICRRHHF